MKHKAHILAAVGASVLFAGSMASPMHVVPAIGQSGLQLAWEAGNPKPGEHTRTAWMDFGHPRRPGKEAIAATGSVELSPAVEQTQEELALSTPDMPATPELKVTVPDWEIRLEWVMGVALPAMDVEALLEPVVLSEAQVRLIFLPPGRGMMDRRHDGPGFGPPPRGPQWFADAGPINGPHGPYGHSRHHGPDGRGMGHGPGHGPGFGPPPHPMF